MGGMDVCIMIYDDSFVFDAGPRTSGVRPSSIKSPDQETEARNTIRTWVQVEGGCARGKMGGFSPA